MKTRIISDTDLHVSSICLGGGPIGISLRKKDSYRALDFFIDKGGNFIDTANVYGKWLIEKRNTSEEMLGKWFVEKGNRSRCILATKGAHPDLSTMHIPRLSRSDIEMDLEESLRTLQTDYIDLYWLHRDDESRPVSDIIETMNRLVHSGKIRYFGCSNWKINRIKEAQQYAANNHIKGFVANQLMWSLAIPNAEGFEDKSLVTMDDNGMKFHKDTGMTAVAYSSQANGFFSKLEQIGFDHLNDRIKRIYGSSINLERFNRVKILSKEIGQSVTTIALAYIMSQTFAGIPIIGYRNVEQLEESLKAADVRLDQKAVTYLEDGIA